MLKEEKNICAYGERIVLEFATKEDKRLVYDMLVSPEIIDFMFNTKFPAPTWKEFDEGEDDNFFSGEPNDEGNYLLIKVNGEVIGTISYAINTSKIKSAELDIWISSISNIGKGYGSEAIRLVIEYVHKNYSINTFMFRPWSKNIKAIEAYIRCGFKEIEDYKSSNFYSNEEAEKYGDGDYGDETINLIYNVKK